MTRSPCVCLLEGLHKAYRRQDGPLVAIDDVSLRVAEGELVSLLGPSGCGKTTILRVLAGLTPATAGRALIRGRDARGPQPECGFVFQRSNLMPWRTILGNVVFPMEVLGQDGRAARKRALELLELVGLKGFENALPRELSGGMSQRASLCRALIHRPSLLLMDEPFAGLDELARMEMNDLLLGVRAATGATIVFVTHDIAEAVYLSDRVLVLTPRPARVAARIEIDLPHPRCAETRYSARFTELEHQASAALGLTR